MRVPGRPALPPWRPARVAPTGETENRRPRRPLRRPPGLGASTPRAVVSVPLSSLLYWASGRDCGMNDDVRSVGFIECVLDNPQDIVEGAIEPGRKMHRRDCDLSILLSTIARPVNCLHVTVGSEGIECEQTGNLWSAIETCRVLSLLLWETAHLNGYPCALHYGR